MHQHEPRDRHARTRKLLVTLLPPILWMVGNVLNVNVEVVVTAIT